MLAAPEAYSATTMGKLVSGPPGVSAPATVAMTMPRMPECSPTQRATMSREISTWMNPASSSAAITRGSTITNRSPLSPSARQNTASPLTR